VAADQQGAATDHLLTSLDAALQSFQAGAAERTQMLNPIFDSFGMTFFVSFLFCVV
jgi:hypothetical protein